MKEDTGVDIWHPGTHAHTHVNMYNHHTRTLGHSHHK